MRKLSIAWLCLAAACGCGCQHASEDQTPIATVRHFLDAMDRSADDEQALNEAFQLLDATTRAGLARRAERASQLAGRAYEPWQMLVQGRFRLRFSPAAPGGMRERVQ